MAFTPKVWANSPATTTPLSAAALTDLESRVTNYNAGNGGGTSNIVTSESRTNVAYGTLTTPDQVTGVVLPANGLIAVWYQATWQESVQGASFAALFLGSNQIQFSQGPAGPSPQAASNSGVVNKNVSLGTWAGGLFSPPSTASSYSGDAITGQIVGVQVPSTATQSIGGAPPQSNTQSSISGGPCYIFATAGTYTVSVQFKASSGSVTASNRQLWVQTLAFS